MESQIVEPNTLAVITTAEIDKQISTAKKFPRDLVHFTDKMTQMVAPNEKTAQKCMYVLPRDGKAIEGPSARFAEIAAYQWGNCRVGARVVNEEHDFVVAQGVFHDLEANTSTTYEVKRRIVDKNGNRYKPDMIGVTANAACSIAIRNAILKGIPHTFWEPAFEEVREMALGDAKKLEQNREQAIKLFKMIQVDEAMICRVLKIEKVEEIDLEKLRTLRGIFTAIKEGDTTVEQAFGEHAGSAGQAKEDDLNSKLKTASTTKQSGAPADEAKVAQGPAVPDAAQEPPKADTPPDPGDAPFSIIDIKAKVNQIGQQTAKKKLTKKDWQTVRDLCDEVEDMAGALGMSEPEYEGIMASVIAAREQANEQDATA